ncbi:caspase, EACC1-associated type [Actinoplanes solisilvae]|uniref:caspase, EACC1-associated type n=1 Tax=Actinoplanes solisilvae TaxID=2486853 RepID=UPI001F0C1765|nr:FhaA domain-containing protein [Actinoplanes solisilvae]
MLPDPASSRAVLIGSGSFVSDSLSNYPAIGDSVAGMASLLTGAHGLSLPTSHCTVVSANADAREVGKALHVASRAATDLLVVYYAGHGLVSKRGALYLALADTDHQWLNLSALDFEDVKEFCTDTRARRRLVILDCCYSGRAIGEPLSATMAGILDKVSISGTFTLTAAPANREALVIPGERYTAFTGRLLSLLNDGDPEGPEFWTLDEIYLRLRTSLLSENLPEPQRSGTKTIDKLSIARNRLFGNVTRAVVDLTDDAGQSPQRLQYPLERFISVPVRPRRIEEPVWARFESSLRRIVGPHVSGTIDFHDVMNRLQREAARIVVSADGDRWVPHRYTVSLSGDDFSSYFSVVQLLAQCLAESQANFVGSGGWDIADEITVELRKDPLLNRGIYRVTAD